MNILIIYAHPNHEGLSYSILKEVQNSISNEYNVETLDLYEISFDPVLYFDKNNKRRNLDKNEYVKPYMDMITKADKIIFIFPIWWGGMPAILKGFTDRVFVKGFAYEFKGIMPVKLLKGKKAWIINTHDTPVPYVKLVQQDYGNVLKKQILKMCGIKTKKHITLSFVKKKKKIKIEKFIKKVGKKISKI